ncbi:MAG TPA: FAD-binding oxidoreductase [Thermoanaerobaculia bacterium]|nr:FAD-binding oxidoreductase [Thermoanaerobaculia bacterium]
MSYLSLVRLAKKNGFTVTCPWDASYQKDSKIWNRRLQTGPAMVAFCKKTEDVQLCVKWCRENDFPLRVRSGGHHHEGMSCDYGVLIIDLSLMDKISYPEHNLGWIPPGKQLQWVYKELEDRKQIIPGGGCETVCVGGLTLGGGWGMSARALGLTCDNILKAEIVMADGSVRTVSPSDFDPRNSSLFWALQGGGAGNFGIVTNFLFKLTNVEKKTTLEQKWTGDYLRPMMEYYMDAIANDDFDRLATLACRLYIDRKSQKMTFMVTGQTLEIPERAEEILGKQLKANHPPDSSIVAEQGAAAEGNAVVHHFADSKLTGASSNLPPDTCKTGPLPHKVSSAFVKVGQEVKAAEACYEFLSQNNKLFPNAETYISFHSFGGAIGDIAPDQTAFPYRDRKLLLQFQAWWCDPADESTDQYIHWIRDVRTMLASRGLTDGGFFNFQDASIVPETDRHALMKYYYGHNLDKLIGVKIQHDPTNVFQSGMSIPNKR